MEAICRILETRDKGLILQTAELQVYTLKDSRGGGFLVHFEDRNRAKISLDINEMKRWSGEFIDRIERLYKVFSRKTIARRKRLEKTNESTIEEKLIAHSVTSVYWGCHQLVVVHLSEDIDMNSEPKTYILAKRTMDSKKRFEEEFNAHRTPILSPYVRMDILRDSFEFSLSPDKDVIILCGERFHEIPEKSEFVLRLMRKQGDTGNMASIEFSWETFCFLKSRMEAVCRILETRDKGLILQTAEVQVYALEDSRGVGFMEHFTFNK
ncbi:hypothetical protein TSAR_002072, partial [Trichomalopsis sarcophagae]